MGRLDDLVVARKQAEAAYKAALAEEHDWIRQILTSSPYGTPYGMKKHLAEKTGYSSAHLDRIKQGKTSGSASARDDNPAL